MQFEPTRLPEVVLIKPRVFSDERGFFFETWQRKTFADAGITASFVQDNHSHSIRHTLRGLHFQIEHPQGKLVRVVRGEAYDVAVDIRRTSPRFGQWVGVCLSEGNHQMLWVPAGFAHGYLTLSDEVDLLYQCTDFYAPEHERAVRWDDPAIGVQWPLPAGTSPILSRKDSIAPMLRDVGT
jgi:dTDP-4-dehydrorhamnose 3,5-epimerase